MSPRAVSKYGLSQLFKPEFQSGESVQDCSAANGLMGKSKQAILHLLTGVLALARWLLAICRRPVEHEAYLGDLAVGQGTPVGKGGKTVLGKTICIRLVQGSREKCRLSGMPFLDLHFRGPRTSAIKLCS